MKSTKIRLGFVMHVMQVAGAEVLVTKIIEQLSSEIEPTVFCLDGIGELGERLLKDGIPVVNLNRKSGIDWQVARRLASETKAREIQVLHAHQYTPYFYSALSRLAFGSRMKIMFTEHGRHYPDVVSFKRRLINKLILRRYADICTACCDFSTEALQRNEGFPQAVTLRNGIDSSKIQMRGDSTETKQLRQQLGLHPDQPYAACIARFHPVKDHKTLIESWKLVVQAVPNAKLLLVGDGECRKEYETLANELGLSQSIEFTGIRHDVPDILRAVDVFTLTSVSEAASLTLLEAMASGCPSVLTDVGGNGEHVSHGQEGLLAARGDTVGIAKHIINLFSNPDGAKKMGQNARKRVASEFDLATIINGYGQCFNRLASN